MSTKKQGRREKLRRLLSVILAVLMIISVCGTLIYNVFMSGVYAADAPADVPASAKSSVGSTGVGSTGVGAAAVGAAGVDSEADNKNIRIGLMYGQNVTVGFETVAPYGFGIMKVDYASPERSSELIWQTDITKVSCVDDANLSKTDMTYSKTASGAKTVIGGWHIEIGQMLTRSDAENLIAALTPTLESLGVYAIPSYIGGGLRIRIGHFTNEALTSELAVKIAAANPTLGMSVVGPTDTAVALVDPETDRILFEYDSDGTALGLSALSAPDGSAAYLVTPAKKLYAGVFMFRRYNKTVNSGAGSVDGVALTNIIRLGDYIKGVLPYEISNSWPLESQKAFAICVRSFTLSGLNRHEAAYGFDICNSTHCQVYGGCTRINEAVDRAVDETAGQIINYGGEIVTAYYSAVSGGVTVSSEDAWGGVIPYLVAIDTPWEIYTNHAYGVWQSEVSPTELYSYLHDTKGYTQLKGKISSINIDKLATNSTYIAQLTITDIYGNSVTIKKSDAIRTALAKYVNSANFVVGRGSVEADVTTFASDAIESTTVRTASGSAALANSSAQSVLTGAGTASVQKLDGVKVVNPNGTGELGKLSSTTVRTTIKAESSGNFIFYGKGQGHGVGLSQIGLRDLAYQGYSAAEMLELYFNGIEITDYRKLG